MFFETLEYACHTKKRTVIDNVRCAVKKASAITTRRGSLPSGTETVGYSIGYTTPES